MSGARDEAGAPSPRSVVELLAQLEELEVDVEKLVTGGDGLARYRGIPIFVPRSVPGDRLRVRLVERRPGYGRAEILEVLVAGSGRRQPPCPHFARCGGCDLQQIEDRLQPELKAASVVETIARLGGLELPPPEVVSGEPWGYRLRTSLHVADGEAGVEVGYHERGSHRLVPVSSCPVLAPQLEAVLPGLPATLPASPPRRIDLAAGDGGSWTAAPVVEGLARGPVERSVGGHTLRYDARTFFQGHGGLLEQLVDRAVGPWQGEAAGELYCGVGLFTLALAGRYRELIAVEGDRIASRYARMNLRRNRIQGVELVTGRVERALERLPHGLDRLLVDPPRTGLGREVRSGVLACRPLRLTYVSCDPPTLARDLRELGAGYRVEQWSVLDLFPQTAHMEVVVQLVPLG